MQISGSRQWHWSCGSREFGGVWSSCCQNQWTNSLCWEREKAWVRQESNCFIYSQGNVQRTSDILRNVGDKYTCRSYREPCWAVLLPDPGHPWDTTLCPLGRDLAWLNLIIAFITYKLKNRRMWPRRETSKCFENVTVLLFKIRGQFLVNQWFLWGNGVEN